MPLDRHAREQLLQVEGDHLLEGDGGVNGFVLLAAQVRGDGDEARQIFLGNFHPGKLPLSCFRINNHGRNVEAQVADEGERMGGVHRQRCEHRKHRGLEGVVNPLALVVVQLFVIEQLNLVFQQLRPQVLAVMHLLLSQQGNQPFPDRQQLLQRRFAILTWLADARLHLRLQ